MGSTAVPLSPRPRAGVLLPQQTRSASARTLHAMLRQCPGYDEHCHSPRRVHWVLQSLLTLHEQRKEVVQTYLPTGCIGAALRLQKVIPFIPRLTRELSVEAICLLIVQLAWQCQFVDTVLKEAV